MAITVGVDAGVRPPKSASRPVTASDATSLRFLSEFGVDLRPRTRRIFCQPCLDWSERRYHLKGLAPGAKRADGSEHRHALK